MLISIRNSNIFIISNLQITGVSDVFDMKIPGAMLLLAFYHRSRGVVTTQLYIVVANVRCGIKQYLFIVQKNKNDMSSSQEVGQINLAYEIKTVIVV